jgi:hypothetical protein
MTNIVKGLIVGTVLGLVSVIPMVSMTFEDKARAMTASFVSRFAIGFIIINMELPMPGWIKGGLIGLVLSLPDALVTKQYTPILGLGMIGGVICGFFSK